MWEGGEPSEKRSKVAKFFWWLLRSESDSDVAMVAVGLLLVDIFVIIIMLAKDIAIGGLIVLCVVCTLLTLVAGVSALSVWKHWREWLNDNAAQIDYENQQ